ncbi:putative RNA 3'-terminal phosphate cyclase-like protein [Ceratocystis fimbriata CBS 114723]|uniref:Putative RNA 3'-terminal phosphate cyclase-like protein n=1 Tax=Ceratocystis fimbriata CBS 114723 TaxID=1035309 RepID=A0A2C5X5F3_9PEZI|nr:putative RNA 3'-terminal phosphate cyclase-like protein [Ceratocystis fimbriata CBS 114723]
MASTPEAIHFTGHIAFAQRLALSTLTGRPVVISQIRNSSPTHPGLAPHEVSFLRLLDTVTNGSSMQISLTGTRITFHPGLITGAIDGVGAIDGDLVEHRIEANNNRGVTYFLLPICLLAPFSKGHMNIRFTGPGVITSATETGDISVDTFRTSILPLFGLFGIPPARIELRIITRSCAGKNGRGGGGVVELRFASQVRLPKTLHLNRSDGRIRRIRGVAYCTGVSASSNNRMIQAAREILNPLVPDINIAAQYDTAPLVADKNGDKRRTGIGFGLSLVAESSSIGVIYSADVPAPPHGGVIPEDIGKQCAYQLLESISTGGCVSKEAVPTVLTLMAMGSEDIGRVRLSKGAITPEFVRLARDLKQFGGSAWGIRPVDDESDDLVVSVKGFGVGNVARKVA